MAAPVVVPVPIPRDPAVVTGVPVVAPVVASQVAGAVVNPVLPTVDDDAPMQAANTIPQVSWMIDSDKSLLRLTLNANFMKVTDAVIPGPTYLEAMEDDESGAKVYKIEMKCVKSAESYYLSPIQSDVAMESHPATPAGSMHKAESTTMLCEDSGGPACGTANTSSSSDANVSSGEVSLLTTFLNLWYGIWGYSRPPSDRFNIFDP